MEPAALIARLKAAGIKHDVIADALGKTRTVVVKILGGSRPLKAYEIAPLEQLLAEHDKNGVIETGAYVAVEVFPTFGGMGGGGNGTGDREIAMLPRSLLEGTLRGNPSNFIMVEMRGTSMEPRFEHGDQVLIDKRDTDCRRMGGGPFFLRIGDAHLLKNIEITRNGLRVFSTNTEYSDEMFGPDEIEVIGRPVWFGRLV